MVMLGKVHNYDKKRIKTEIVKICLSELHSDLNQKQLEDITRLINLSADVAVSNISLEECNEYKDEECKIATIRLAFNITKGLSMFMNN